jgi:predicted ATPase
VNSVSNDGRVVLRKDYLKALRRELGASQEKVAFLCADQGLCVSVASLKRAETSKNVLYRTAKDLAIFYQIDVSKLIDETPQQISSQSSLTPIAEIEKHNKKSSPSLAVRRNFILLGCSFPSFGQSGFNLKEFISSISHIANQYGAVFHRNTDEYFYYTFGLEKNPGNEVKRALWFGYHFLKSSNEFYKTQVECHLAVCWAEAQLGGNAKDPVDEKYILQVQAILAAANSCGLFVSTNVKNALPNEFQCSDVIHDDNKNKIWKITLDSENVGLKRSQPFIGRKVELTQFKAILESTVDYSSTHFVHLVGPPGIGKTRLLNEFCHLAALDDFDIHRMSILDFHVEQNQQAIPQLLHSLLEINNKEKNLSLEELVNRNHLVWLNESQSLPLLYSLLHWPLPKEWSSLLDAMSTERLHAARSQIVSNILKTKSYNKPLLICCEDYHWADKQLRQYIQNICAEVENLPLIFLISSRPGDAISELVSVNERANLDLTQIFLSPLSKKDALDFAKAISKQDIVSSIDNDCLQQCIEKAQGNPLFLEQLLLDDSTIENNSLPFSLQTLISSRVDNMNADDQLAVRTASVIGRIFSLQLLRELVNNSAYDPSVLVHANLIDGLEDEFSFKHALIMEGIYLSIAEPDRQKLHYQCSQWFENDIVLQCQHLLKAQHGSATDKILPAVDYLIQHYDYHEAKNLVELGLIVANNKNISIRLYESLADINNRLGETQEALRAYREMLSKSLDPEDKIKAYIGLFNCLNTLDDSSDAQDNLEQAYSIAKDYGKASLLSQIYYLKGNYLFPSGKVDECLDLQQQAFDYALKAQDTEMQARSLGGLGDAAYAQGKMQSAYDYFSRCLQLCDQHDLKTVSAANYFMLGTVSIYHNKTEEALAVTEKSIMMAELVGHKRAEIVSRLTASWILLDWLRVYEANEHIDIALRLAEEIGAKRFVPFLLEAKARYYLSINKFDDGLAAIDDAREKVEFLNAESFIGPWVLSTRALFASDWSQAKAILDEGSALLEKGCVGHNYYQFYRTAIDVCLKYKKLEALKQYLDKFQNYLGKEPVPWANYFISRAEFLADSINKKTDSAIADSLLANATESKLLSSISSIDDALSNIVTL